VADSILIIDDETLMRPSLVVNLEQARYRRMGAASAEQPLALVQVCPPEVIFLTARRKKLDQVLELERGSINNVTQPFDLDVFLARVKAVIAAQLARVAGRWGQVLVPAAFAVGVLLLVLAAPHWMGWVQNVATSELPSEEMMGGWLTNLVFDPVTTLNTLLSGAVQAWLNSGAQMDVLVALASIVLALASVAGLVQLLSDEHKVTFLCKARDVETTR